MGSGGSRELSSESKTDRVLSTDLSEKLTKALAKLDDASPEFKESRAAEKHAQEVKTWHKVGQAIVDHLREVGKVLIASHQLSLDMGSEGGGAGMRPWVDEIGGARFDRLTFEMRDGRVSAKLGSMPLSRIALSEVDYEWVELMVVEWAIVSAAKRC